MTLNPSELFFYKGNGELLWRDGTPYRLNDYEKVPNTIFSGVLKVLSVGEDITVEIQQGPADLIGKKTSQFAAREFNKALSDGTLGYDSQGLYLSGTWVFVKRGNYVRLISYKA